MPHHYCNKQIPRDVGEETSTKVSNTFILTL